jgi:exodeoxyribonuclease III
MRIATWNVNSLKVRLPRVEAWLDEVRPDVVLLQETKLADGAFPGLPFEALGYQYAHHGQGQWNGVAILSRVGIEDVVANFADGEAPDNDARVLTATCGGVRCTSVYVPNGRSLDDDHYTYKLAWLERLRRQLDRTSTPDQPLVIGGDFNIAPADVDVWNGAKAQGNTHVSAPERDALDRLKAWGLGDLFRQIHPDGPFYSWWDYRAGDFHMGRGMRIDYILGTAPVQAATTWAIVDRNARKGTQPSDHAPVIIDLEPTW